MDQNTLMLKYGQTVMHITEINKIAEKAYNQGYNKGMIVGAVTLIVAQQAYKHSDKIWAAIFGRKN